MPASYFPQLLRQPPPPGARVVLLLSDIEMGEPGPEDDFPHDAFLADLFQAYTQPPYDGVPVDLVLNGDVLDFLKVRVDGRFPRHITADVALRKLDTILDGHPAFMEGLRAFGQHSSGNKNIHFVPGNHDPEVHFPEVADALKLRLDGVASVRVHGISCRIGPVHIEHGHQYDPLFRMDPEHLFIPYKGDAILHLPWMSIVLLDAVMPMKHLFYHHDRLRPKNRVMERLPQLEELVLGGLKRYWVREYLWDALTSFDDPTRVLTWDMLKEVAYRMYSSDPDVGMQDEPLMAMLNREPEIQAVCLGHLHIPAWRLVDRQHIVRTGCMRDEYTVDPYTDALYPLDKSYAELLLIDNRVVEARVFHVPGPARPTGSFPEDVFTLTPAMEELLQAYREG